MPNVGVPELIIFAVILLLLFGAKRVPEIMRSLGTGMREFKEGVTDTGSKDEVSRPEIAATVPQPTTPVPAEPAAAVATPPQATAAPAERPTADVPPSP
jgi:sec-independent protein translocase protein TatA